MALADLNRALELEPDDIEIYFDRGKMYFESGRVEEALADMTRIIQLKPNDPRGYGDRAVDYIILKQYDRAIADLTQCITLAPDDAKAYRNRGHALTLNREFAEAIADYSKAIELDPDVSGDLSSRSNLLIHMGRYEEAIADLSHLIEMQEEPGAILLARGMVYELVGATRLALANYDRAAALSGPIGQYAALWKYILLHLSGQEQAAADLLASHNAGANSHAWTDRLFDLFEGVISGEQLLAAAATEDERCEAHYYIATHALVNGETAGAVEALRTCKAMNRPAILETKFARARLKQLEDGQASAEQDSPRPAAATDPVSNVQDD